MEQWEIISNLFSKSNNSINIEQLDENVSVIEELKINPDSILGEIVRHVSSLSINSYLRVLGGNRNKNNIFTFNLEIKKIYPGNKLIVANDIWGGLFAINNGDFEDDLRNIWYYAPDELQWINLKIDYSEFISWICSDNINLFYENLMWNDMNDLIFNIDENQAVLIYPFLWSKECNINSADKKIIELAELIKLNADYQNKFGL